MEACYIQFTNNRESVLRKNRGHLQVSGRLFSRIVKAVIHLQSPYFSNAFFNETHNSSGA